MTRWAVWRQPKAEQQARYVPKKNEIIRVFNTEVEAEKFAYLLRRLVGPEARDYWTIWEKIE